MHGKKYQCSNYKTEWCVGCRHQFPHSHSASCDKIIEFHGPCVEVTAQKIKEGTAQITINKSKNTGDTGMNTIESLDNMKGEINNIGNYLITQGDNLKVTNRGERLKIISHRLSKIIAALKNAESVPASTNSPMVPCQEHWHGICCELPHTGWLCGKQPCLILTRHQ